MTRLLTWRRPLTPALTLLTMLSTGAFGAPRLVGASSVSRAHTAHAAVHQAASQSARSAGIARASIAMPLRFEANRGQTDSRVKFLSRGAGYTLFLTATDAVLSLAAPSQAGAAGQAGQASGYVVRLRFVGANAHARVVGLDRLAGATSYFAGRDPRRWRTGIPSYGRVAYQDLYRGVTLVYHEGARHLEYDFALAPGASPRAIKLAVSGAQSLRIDAAGNLIVRLPNGDLRQDKPFVYQTFGGRRHAVSGRYVLMGHETVGFAVGRYDTARPLVIDPSLDYSTYLGGSGDSGARAIATGNAGKVYVTGQTTAPGFPTVTGAYSATAGGNTDAFVAELNPTGHALIYSTYLGGSDDDAGAGIAVDSKGGAYVIGSTSSSDFPTSTGAYSATNSGGSDAFVAELGPGGATLRYSTYLGGSDLDTGASIALDGAGHAYVVGSTSSTDFPTTPGAYATANKGGSDAFVAKLDTAASGRPSLVYSTLLGGGDFDTGAGIAVDGAGDAYVTGATSSSDSPTTSAAFATGYRGGSDAFVAKLNASGAALVYSTFLGGVNADYGQAVAVDNAGAAYVTGYTESSDFPTRNPLPFSGATSTASACNNFNPSGYSEAFVTKLAPSGGALDYSTYLGGSGDDAGYGIAVDSAGDAYVTGSTTSTDFPTTTGAYATANKGGADAFVAKLDDNGNGLLYSSLLGGGSDDTGYGVAADGVSIAYVAGQTSSTDFPTANALYGANPNSQSSAFVAKLSGLAGEPSATATSNPPLATATSTPAPATCTPIPPTATDTPIPPTATPAPAGLAAYYPFDEGSGTVAHDVSGNGHDGALQGNAAWATPGKVGPHAISFDGSSGTDVDVHGPVVNTAQSYSVAAWVNLAANTDFNGFHTAVSIDGQQVSGFFLQYCAQCQTFAFAVIDGDSSSAGGVRAQYFNQAGQAVKPATGTWYHLVGIYDANAHQIKLYVNGQLADTESYSAAWQAMGDTEIGRGKFGGNPVDFFQGQVDDVHLYNGALTDAQIQQLYSGQTPATATAMATATGTPATSTPQPATPTTQPAALNAYYKFDEGTGITATDSSGAGHTGALQTGATWGPGKIGPYAISLDGVGGSVDVPGPVIDTGKSFSVAAWANLQNTSGFHTVASIDGQQVSGFFLQYCDVCHTFAFARLTADDPSAPSVRAVATSPGSGQVATGAWYHLVGVYDASAGRLELYVDGQLQGSAAYSGGWTANGNTEIGRGKYGGNPVDFFPGEIDDVHFYQGVLTGAQVQQLYAGQTPGGPGSGATSGATTGDGATTGGDGTVTPELGSGELLIAGLGPILAALLYRRRMAKRKSNSTE